ncbi:hypothetical protein [Actinoplanes palleronii]|uniref:Uncharacterized protein n=1 Tax=Actinoplanes palleronii TaxID=113570 RepID=A0ABQ4BG66_9ACTN|nr:hypothetical protein [Actinoplanes palleronii]GIE69680.1 hypothetical protein Apa02nite_057880 [Actinoplanes palleronii]
MGAGSIYVPVGSQRHQWLQCVREEDFDALNSLDLQSRVSSSWRLRVRLIEHDECGDPLQGSGLLCLSSQVLVMTAAVWDAVRPVLEGQGVLARLQSDDGDFWMFVPDLCDALNEAGSSVARFSSGRVMYVSRYDFHPERLVDQTAFRIPQMPKGPLLCTQDVVDALSEESGVSFQRVWPTS